MRIDRDSDRLLLTLEPCCTIVYVEEHTALLKEALAGIVAGGVKIARLTIDISDVEEMDTAYMQMLLVCKQHFMRQGAVFVLQGVSPCVSELQECFGISPKDTP